MLFQPLITFVVLTINIGNISAMFQDKEKTKVPQYIDSPNQSPTVPKAKGRHSLPFLHRNKPPVSQNINPQYNKHPSDFQSPYPPVFQSPHHPHHPPHPHHQPLHRITPPVEDPNFSNAQCGISYYNKDDIIAARSEGCRKLPIYHDNIVTRKAVEYKPANPSKYNGETTLYLYPIGKPIAGVTRNRHYGLDRIVINQWCQAVNVLTERPHVMEFLRKTGKFLTRRPLENYDQKNYKYVDCMLT